MTKEETIKVGDEVYIEQAWEDEAGHYHDVYATVTQIRPDGTLRFRIGQGCIRKNRTPLPRGQRSHDQKIQAYINSMEWYAENVTKQS